MEFLEVNDDCGSGDVIKPMVIQQATTSDVNIKSDSGEKFVPSGGKSRDSHSIVDLTNDSSLEKFIFEKPLKYFKTSLLLERHFKLGQKIELEPEEGNKSPESKVRQARTPSPAYPATFPLTPCASPSISFSPTACFSSGLRQETVQTQATRQNIFKKRKLNNAGVSCAFGVKKRHSNPFHFGKSAGKSNNLPVMNRHDQYLDPPSPNGQHGCSKLDRSKMRGYPTYFERFLATVFSWCPEWAERPTISFDVSDLRLPLAFGWLEHNVEAIKTKQYFYRTFNEFKATFIPIILLKLFHDINEELKRQQILDSNSNSINRTITINRSSSNEYIRRDSREGKAFMSEVQFAVDRSCNSEIEFKKGDLVLVSLHLPKKFTSLALVANVDTVVPGERNIRDRDLKTVGIEDHVVLLIKKAVANKINGRSFEVKKILNIECYLLEAKGVYDFGNCRRFVRPFLEPIPFADFNPNITCTSGNFSDREILVINSVIDFILSGKGKENILAVISGQAKNRTREVFLEIIQNVVEGSNEDDKFLLVVPDKTDIEWVEFVIAQFWYTCLRGLSSLRPSIWNLNKNLKAEEILDKWTQLGEDRYDKHFIEELNRILPELEGDCDQLPPFVNYVINRMWETVEISSIAKSRIIISSLSNILTQNVRNRLDRYKFKTCLVYDTGLSQSQVCSICTMSSFESLVCLGPECQNQQHSLPVNFISRFGTIGHRLSF